MKNLKNKEEQEHKTSYRQYSKRSRTKYKQYPGLGPDRSFKQVLWAQPSANYLYVIPKQYNVKYKTINKEIYQEKKKHSFR